MPSLAFESFTLQESKPPIQLQLAYRKGSVKRHPVILMLGGLRPNEAPFWSTNLLNEGYLLATFTPQYPPDPNPRKQPQWLFFDQRLAHSYVLGTYRAPIDAGRVIDLLSARKDVDPSKFGWLGSSSTSIPGFAVATRDPRLAAIVAFVGTGAVEHWIDSWHTNNVWKGKEPDLWPETDDLLRYDPIRHVNGLYPAAVLMVNGANDRIVDPSSARAFHEAAQPFYKSDPSRLRLVMYEGMGHNLPQDLIKLYAEHWFHLYLPVNQPNPKPAPPTPELPEPAEPTPP